MPPQALQRDSRTSQQQQLPRVISAERSPSRLERKDEATSRTRRSRSRGSREKSLDKSKEETGREKEAGEEEEEIEEGETKEDDDAQEEPAEEGEVDDRVNEPQEEELAPSAEKGEADEEKQQELLSDIESDEELLSRESAEKRKGERKSSGEDGSGEKAVAIPAAESDSVGAKGPPRSRRSSEVKPDRKGTDTGGGSSDLLEGISDEDLEVSDEDESKITKAKMVDALDVS